MKLLSRSSVAAILAFAAATACSESTGGVTGSVSDVAAVASISGSRDQALAVDIARAFETSSVRSSSLRALRASPWVEHKLVLQEFVRSSLGTPLVTELARLRGVSVESVIAEINSLPLLDFYVPSRNERLAWRGEATVRVALSLDMDTPPTHAYTSSGEHVPFLKAHEAGQVLILVHPAEEKGRRILRQRATMGEAIQDADDGDVAVQFIQTLDGGRRFLYDLTKNSLGEWVVMKDDGTPGETLAIAILRRSNDALRALNPALVDCGELVDDCSGGGGGGSGTQAPTNVVRIQARSVCDMDCTAANEFEFRAKAYSTATNALLLQGTARVTGVASGNIWYEPWFGSVPMIFTTVASGVRIDVDVVETDPWPNPDDNFDPNPVLRTISDRGRQFHIGDARPWTFCTSGEPICRELTVTFNW